MLRYLTAGESHGRALTVIVEGLPAGLPILAEHIETELARRRLGYGRGPRQRFEEDRVTLVGGVRHGRTLGSPVCIEIQNSEWFRDDKWHAEMSPEPGATEFPLTQPRPGHADMVGMQKYDFDDARPILERASARETASRVALGAIARKFLEQSIGITILSHVVSIGSVRIPDGYELPGENDMARIDEDPVRCADPATSAKMITEIEAAHADGDTLGGVCEVLAYNLPPGLGSHVHWDRRLDARLAAAMMGIQAIKGVEIGDGFRTATRRGSVAHDEIERAKDGHIARRTDRAGGTEGGMSNGEILRVSIAMKPISTVPKALDTIDVKTGEAAKAINQRSDVCAVPASGVVAEAMAALVLAEAVLEKFGGDSVQEVRRNFESYMKNLRFK